MQSLRDKLLKAGLVSEDASHSPGTETRPAPAPRPERPTRITRTDRPLPIHKLAPIPKLPPMAGSKEANRLMAKRQLELDRQIREQVLAAQVAQQPGTTTFYFITRKNKLRRLELSSDQAKQLESGELAVVERPDPDKIEHALVPAQVATALLALSERTVRFLNQAGAQVGFLSEEEIHSRATEADEPPEPEPIQQPVEPGKAPAPTGEGPLITIRRSPKSP